MLTEETTQYLTSLKQFLVEQRLKTKDPLVRELIAEINRELSRRMERGPVRYCAPAGRNDGVEK